MKTGKQIPRCDTSFHTLFSNSRNFWRRRNKDNISKMVNRRLYLRQRTGWYRLVQVGTGWFLTACMPKPQPFWATFSQSQACSKSDMYEHDPDLATLLVRNSVLVTVAVGHVHPLNTQLGFQGARDVVDTCMYDAAVVATLMSRWRKTKGLFSK